MLILKGLVGWLTMLLFMIIAFGALLLSFWNVKDDLKDLIDKK